MNNDEYFIPEDGGQEQFQQEWTQWREEQDEALDDYLIVLFNYYGNRVER